MTEQERERKCDKSDKTSRSTGLKNKKGKESRIKLITPTEQQDYRTKRGKKVGQK